MIDRPAYLERLHALEDSSQIKVLTGMRRCGKSTILNMFVRNLTDRGIPAENIVYRRFDEFEMPLGFTGEMLRQELAQAFEHAGDGKVYVLLDEIQDVPDWQHVVRRLHTRNNTDVYVTGSNATLLSGELATYLTGRYVEIPVYPLSFQEYATWRTRRENAEDVRGMMRRLMLQSVFGDYMRYGGMPGLYDHGSDHVLNAEQWRTELSSIYDSVVVRDVAERHAIRDIATMRKVAQYMFSASGNLVSATNVSNQLKALGYGVSAPTVETWLDALKQAFVLYEAPVERLRGKQFLAPLRKWYAVDNGFRNLVCADPDSDRGVQLENLVFMELKRRGYTVQVGRIGTKEIDFVALKGAERLYIQVTLSMLAPEVRQRELAPLQELDDAFPRLVITMDPLDVGEGITKEGIQIQYAIDWFMNTPLVGNLAS